MEGVEVVCAHAAGVSAPRSELTASSPCPDSSVCGAHIGEPAESVAGHLARHVQS